MQHMMTDDATRMRRIVADVLADTGIVTSPEQMDAGTSLSDLGADALDMMEIVMRAEEVFGVEIDDGMVDTSSTVPDLIAAVCGRT